MSVRILSITVLALVACIQFSAGNNRVPGRRFPPPPCCVTVSGTNISHQVTVDKYREQPAKHPCVKAIILTTERGNVCVDPHAKWVKEAIAKMTKL